VVERPVSVVIPAWVADYEAAGVDVSETGRVALAERLGLLEDEDAIVELRRVLMTETAPVVRGVALLTVGERAFASMSDAVVSAMETGDAYERCAAITALAALGDVAALRTALADEDDGVVRMTVTLLLQTRDADDVRAMIAERAGKHSEVALATVDSLI
jgi:HEAT repeat protein